MKSHRERPNDKSLSVLLKDWKIDSALPPRFQENVWRGIERAELKPSSAITILSILNGWIDRLLLRPTLAVAYVTAMLVIGGITGLSHAQIESNRLHAELSTRYVQSIDPYQANP